MYITIETEKTMLTFEIDSRLQAYNDESLVYEACKLMNTDYLDYYNRSSIQMSDNIVNLDWQPVVNKFRSENVILRRKARKFAI